MLRELAGEPFIFVRRPGAPGMYGDLIEACHAMGFALLTGCMIASYTVVDKLAVAAFLVPPLLQEDSPAMASTMDVAHWTSAGCAMPQVL